MWESNSLDFLIGYGPQKKKKKKKKNYNFSTKLETISNLKLSCVVLLLLSMLSRFFWGTVLLLSLFAPLFVVSFSESISQLSEDDGHQNVLQQSPKKQTILFLHIPKVMGTSLCRQAKENNFSSPTEACWHSLEKPIWIHDYGIGQKDEHFSKSRKIVTCQKRTSLYTPYNLVMIERPLLFDPAKKAPLLCPDFIWGTHLRDPVERVISHWYNFLRYNQVIKVFNKTLSLHDFFPPFSPTTPSFLSPSSLHTHFGLPLHLTTATHLFPHLPPSCSQFEPIPTSIVLTDLLLFHFNGGGGKGGNKWGRKKGKGKKEIIEKIKKLVELVGLSGVEGGLSSSALVELSVSSSNYFIRSLVGDSISDDWFSLSARSLGKKHLDLAYSTLKKMDFVVDTGEGEREESLFQTRLGNVLERYFGFRELKNTGGLSKKNHLSPHFVDCMKGWLTERNQLDIELVKRWRESESSPSV